MKTSQGATTLPPLLPSSMQSIWQAASLSLSLSPPCCHLARWALISVGSDTPRKIYTTSTRTDGRLAEMERYKRHTRERGERVRGPGSDTAATSILPPQSTSWATPQNVLAQRCHSAAGRTELLRYFLSDKMARWGNRICTEMPPRWQKFETKFALCPKVRMNTLCIRIKIHKA